MCLELYVCTVCICIAWIYYDVHSSVVMLIVWLFLAYGVGIGMTLTGELKCL